MRVVVAFGLLAWAPAASAAASIRGGWRLQPSNASKPDGEEHNISNATVGHLNVSSKPKLLGDNDLKFPLVHRPCTPKTTVFDLGFYDGEDSTKYLDAGFCVVGVEADPDLVKQAMGSHLNWITAGRLKMVNAAVAPSNATEGWKTFYRNACTKEWNSFIYTVGCRTCQPPHKPAWDGCHQVSVEATACSSLFSTYGVPHYLKLDIEGAEPGCFESMKHLGKAGIPNFISAEITETEYVDDLHAVGYRGFKLVRQDRLWGGNPDGSGWGSKSGPFGDDAQDCRSGRQWRSYEAVRQEMQRLLSVHYNATDVCPGGLVSLRKGNVSGEGFQYIWYDVHATTAVGVAP